MRPDEKDKYLRIVELGNKMLRDAVRTRHPGVGCRVSGVGSRV